MDPHRFDVLSKILAPLTTRRAVLSLLAGVGFGAGESLDADARKSGKCKPGCGACETCKKGDCKKKDGKKVCKKGTCQRKRAGSPCPVPIGGSCQNGACTCTGGFTNCGGLCVNAQTDEAHCGSSCAVCGTTQVCQAGSCFPRGTCPATATTICGPAFAPCSPFCICALSAENNVVCVSDTGPCATPGPPRCTTSADCAAGAACVEIGGCCLPALPAGTKACMPPCVAPS